MKRSDRKESRDIEARRLHPVHSGGWRRDRDDRLPLAALLALQGVDGAARDQAQDGAHPLGGVGFGVGLEGKGAPCLLYTSPSPRDS